MGSCFKNFSLYKGAPGKGLFSQRYEHIGIESYADSDYIGNIDDKRSITGYWTYIGENLVTWKRKKQYVELWLIHHLRWCGARIFSKIWIFAQGYYDNMWCDDGDAIANIRVLHGRTKHIEVFFCLRCCYIQNNQHPLHLLKESTCDIFTRPLANKGFLFLTASCAWRELCIRPTWDMGLSPFFSYTRLIRTCLL